MKSLISIFLIWLFTRQTDAAQPNDPFLLLKLTPNDVIVSNAVSFVVDHVAGEPPHDMVQFTVTVRNLSTNALPTLNPGTVAKYMQRIIDGRPGATGAEFGGVHDAGGKAVLSKGDSDTHGWGEYLTGSNHWPSVFTIQWTYLGVPSNILKVNMAQRSVEDVTPAKLSTRETETTARERR